MLNRHRLSFAFVAYALIVALSSGGLTHSVIPHTHNDGHSGQAQESLAWVSLHNSLSHEGKKFLALMLVVAFVYLGTIINLGARTVPSLLALNAVIIRTRDPSAGELLRRGIFPYRRFG